MSLLVAHAPLQKNFNVTVYSDTPDSNDVYPVNDTRVMASTTDGTFIDVESIDVGNRTPITLIVSNISSMYDGEYLPVSSCSIGKFRNYPNISTQFDVIPREQNAPLFKKTDADKFLCIPKAGGNVTSWVFFTSTSLDLNNTNQQNKNFSEIFEDTNSFWESTQYNAFTYPVFEGIFSFNFDLHRVSGIKALRMNSGESIVMNKESDFVSFWAWTPNAPSWSLYTVDNGTLKRNDGAFTASDFTIDTSNNITINNTQQIIQIPTTSQSSVDKSDPKNTSFVISGNTYDAGTYSIKTNFDIFSNNSGEYLFTGDTSNYLHSTTINASTECTIEIKLPRVVMLRKYGLWRRSFFNPDGTFAGSTDLADFLPDDWTLKAKVGNSWKIIDTRHNQKDIIHKYYDIDNPADEQEDNIYDVSLLVYSDTFMFTTIRGTTDFFIIGEFQMFIDNPLYITDIKQYSTRGDYSKMNVHPLNPTFGFFQLAHSSDVGIQGNQLDDVLRIVNHSSDSKVNSSLADLEVNDAIVKGNVIADAVHASGMVADDVLCPRVQHAIPKTFVATNNTWGNAFIDTQGDMYVTGSHYALGIGHSGEFISEWKKLSRKYVAGAMSEEASIFIDVSGNAWAAGRNRHGETGLNLDTGDLDLIVKNHTKITQYCLDYNGGNGVVSDIPPEHKWVSAGCNTWASFMIDANGDAWACGENNTTLRNLGLDINTGAYVKVFTRINNYDPGSGITSIPSGHKWVGIHCGGAHSILIDADGNAWAFGYASGPDSLGLGNSGHKAVPTKITNYDIGSGSVSIPTDHKWVSAACGGDHSFLLDSDGYAYSCGYNASGQLANGGNSNKTIFTRIPFGTFVKISCGKDHSMLLKTDGTVLTAGRNNYGQLGNGTNTDTGAKAPSIISFEHPVTDISAQANSSTFVSDNILRVCGNKYTYGISVNSHWTPIMSSNEVTIPHLLCDTLDLGKTNFESWDGGTGPSNDIRTGCKIRYEPLTYLSAGSSHAGTHGQLCFDFNYNGSISTPLTISSGGNLHAPIIVIEKDNSYWGRLKGTNTYGWGATLLWQITDNRGGSWSTACTFHAGGVSSSSDDRLKINERMISDANVLLKLRPQVYDKLSRFEGNVEDATFEAGLIAQEIWYDCPELRHLVRVGEGGEPAEDIKTSDDPTVDPDYSSWGPEVAGVNYTGFIPYLIRGFQEHSEQIEKIDALEKENEKLKAKTASMEAQIAMLMKAVGLVDSGNVDSA